MPKTMQSVSGRRFRGPLLAVTGCLLLVAACTTRTVAPAGTSEMSGMAPALSVERFLQAVNARDLQAMASLFGTAKGPIEGNRMDIERQMDLIAQILSHQDYRVGTQAPVPGQQFPTTRVGVDLTIGGKLFRDVEFLVVRTEQNSFLVEKIDLEAITGG